MAEFESRIKKARDIVEAVHPRFHEAVQRVYDSSRPLPDWVKINAGHGMGVTVGLALAFKVVFGEADIKEVGQLLIEAAQDIYGSQGRTPEYEQILDRLIVFKSEVAAKKTGGLANLPSFDLDEITGEIGIR